MGLLLRQARMISNSLIMLKAGGCGLRYSQTPFFIVGIMRGFGAERLVTEGLGGSDAGDIVSSYINVLQVVSFSAVGALGKGIGLRKG